MAQHLRHTAAAKDVSSAVQHQHKAAVELQRHAPEDKQPYTEGAPPQLRTEQMP